MPEEMLPQRSEPEDEPALRAALAAHAPVVVPVDDAWLTVKPRLMLDATSMREDQALEMAPTRQSARRPWWRRAALTAGIAAILVALMGAGVGAAYWGGLLGGPKARLIGDASLYTTIGQSQTIGGVTLSVDQAYADPGNTYIAVTFRVTEPLAERYGTVILNHVTIRDASGREANGLNVMCEGMGRADLLQGGGIEHCMLDSGPLPAPAGTGPLAVTVEVGEVWLLAKQSGQRTVLSGPWSYQFALPWHQQSLGPGGPYTQPAR
jgi:hypothetical protein